MTTTTLELKVTLYEATTNKTLTVDLPSKPFEAFAYEYFDGRQPSIQAVTCNLEEVGQVLRYVGTDVDVCEVNDYLLKINTIIQATPTAILPLVDAVDKGNYNLAELYDVVRLVNLKDFYLATNYDDLATEILKAEFKDPSNFEIYEEYIDIETYASNLKDAGTFDGIRMNGKLIGFEYIG